MKSCNINKHVLIPDGIWLIVAEFAFEHEKFLSDERMQEIKQIFHMHIDDSYVYDDNRVQTRDVDKIFRAMGVNFTVVRTGIQHLQK